MKMFKPLLVLVSFFVFSSLHAQYPCYWQQKIRYVIDVDMNVQTNQYSGIEKIEYWNNSPDTLHRVFFHLYNNAFQPNSMMDVRSRELGKIEIGNDRNGNPVKDWDDRVTDRISKLQPNEIGYDSTQYVKMNGIAQKLIYHETILEVALSKPILPNSKTNFEVSFKAQVPVQIRRSGRDNEEGVRYSMAQWYPKMVNYDKLGWNANPYVAREFYGVWGDYEVNISIDKNYLLAGSGTIQNMKEVGFGYDSNIPGPAPVKGNKRTWKFLAQNVHDFVWAADPDYKLVKKQIENGPIFYAVYKKGTKDEKKWETLVDSMAAVYPFIAKTFGPYPYKNYSFIEGGDGGMEYPMATLLKGTGAALHEFMHAWYQGMMGTNESLYPWMDEGFTTYAAARVSAWKNGGDAISGMGRIYDSYFRIAKSNWEEPLSTHADHYNTNYAYSVASYNKGAIFLSQLGYIIGEENLDKLLLEYYKEWRFKSPVPDDFIRIAEKISGIQLQWYKQYWINSTKTIEYAIGDVKDINGNAGITLKKNGKMPMPIDLLITYKDGSQELHYIPLDLMYSDKPQEGELKPVVHGAWPWTDPEYLVIVSKGVGDIKEIQIDPSQRMADLNRVNNKIVVP